jgi:hypothetical protein
MKAMTSKILRTPAPLFAVVAVFAASLLHAQTPEVERLQAKVAELEAQNARMEQDLAQMRARLDALARPPAAVPVQAVPATPVNAPQTAVVPAQREPSEGLGTMLGSHFKLYGMLRADMDIDSNRPNNDQTPLFVPAADNAVMPKFGDYSIHPRLSRFGLDLTAPPLESLADAKLTGKIETDFENGGTESRQIIRIRHAYLKTTWKDFSVLGGQTWDIFSPLIPTVNNDTLMWNAGNLGDRRPQVRASYEPKIGGVKWSLVGAVGLTGAIDSMDLDNNGYRDGEQSGAPNLQARAGLAKPLWVKAQPFSLGLSEFFEQSSTAKLIAGRNQFNAQALNVDYTLPLVARAALRGEVWWGSNLSDVRGGIGQGFNSTLGRLIHARGGWSELSLKATRRWSVHPGFTIDDPLATDLSKGNRSRNFAYYIANRVTFDNVFQLGFDYLRWTTDYLGAKPALDNRVNLFVQYGF